MEREDGRSGPQALLARIETLRSLPTLPHILLRLIELCNRPEKGLQGYHPPDQPGPGAERAGAAPGELGLLQPEAEDLHHRRRRCCCWAWRRSRTSPSAPRCTRCSRGRRRKHGLDLKRFWWHSVRCGVVARRLAIKTAYPSPDEAFLGGPAARHRQDPALVQLSPGVLRGPERAGAAGRGAAGWASPTPRRGPGCWAVGNCAPSCRTRYATITSRWRGSRAPSRWCDWCSPPTCWRQRSGASMPRRSRPWALGPRGTWRSLRAEAEEEARQIASSLEIRIEAARRAARPPGRAKDEALARLVRDYSQLAGISEGFLKASRREDVLEALRRGLALLFDLASTPLLPPGRRVAGGRQPAAGGPASCASPSRKPPACWPAPRPRRGAGLLQPAGRAQARSSTSSWPACWGRRGSCACRCAPKARARGAGRRHPGARPAGLAAREHAPGPAGRPGLPGPVRPVPQERQADRTARSAWLRLGPGPPGRARSPQPPGDHLQLPVAS